MPIDPLIAPLPAPSDLSIETVNTPVPLTPLVAMGGPTIVFGTDPAGTVATQEGSGGGEPSFPQFPLSGGGILPEDTVTTSLDYAAIAAYYIPVVGPLISALLEIIKFVYQIVELLIQLFSGVPEGAKTAGTASRLLRAHDPLAEMVGLNLANGATAGRVLSEGGWPHNLGGRIIGIGGALIRWANYTPTGSYWRSSPIPKPGPNNNPYALEYRLGPIPPPKGAPYNNTVTINGFFADQPLTPAQYKTLWGHDQPSAEDISYFLSYVQHFRWDIVLEQHNTIIDITQSFEKILHQLFEQWLSQGKPNEPPSGNPQDCACSEELGAIKTAVSGVTESIRALLIVIQNWIAGGGGGGGGGGGTNPSDDCCTKVVAALGQIDVDLKAENTQLAMVIQSLAPVLTAAARLTSPIVNVPPPDLHGIEGVLIALHQDIAGGMARVVGELQAEVANENRIIDNNETARGALTAGINKAARLEILSGADAQLLQS